MLKVNNISKKFDNKIIFDEEKDRREGYIDCCHIIIDDHGIKQQKVIRTETL